MTLFLVRITEIVDGQEIVRDPLTVTRRRVPTEVDAALQNVQGRVERIEIERFVP